MARQPKLILRESALEDEMRSWNPGTFLEVGSGTGYMTRKLLDKQFRGACFELGDAAREKLKDNLQSYGKSIDVLDDLSALEKKQFDYLFSFEVLEHIEEDLSALKLWSRYLKPSGQILLSVPAHQHKYGKADELVGHVRRYERSQLIELLEMSGYHEIRIINYGFPVSEITRPISNMLLKNVYPERSLSMTERSTQSSFKRQTHIQAIINLMGENIFLPFSKIQRWFYHLDWADGIIASARKI